MEEKKIVQLEFPEAEHFTCENCGKTLMKRSLCPQSKELGLSFCKECGESADYKKIDKLF